MSRFLVTKGEALKEGQGGKMLTIENEERGAGLNIVAS